MVGLKLQAVIFLCLSEKHNLSVTMYINLPQSLKWVIPLFSVKAANIL